MLHSSIKGLSLSSPYWTICGGVCFTHVHWYHFTAHSLEVYIAWCSTAEEFSRRPDREIQSRD